MKKKESVFNSFKFKIFLVGFITIVTSASLTFGFFFAGKSQSGISGLNTLSCFDMTFTDADSINLEKTLPLSDEVGMETSPYTFTIKNNCNEASNYYVILNVKAGSFSENFLNLTYDEGNITRISLFASNTISEVPAGYERSYIIARGTLEGSQDQSHRVRIWLDKDTTYEDVRGGSWEGQIKVVSVVKELDDLTNPTPVDKTLKVLGKTVKEGNPNFAEPATTDETADGLYAMVDDYGTSYYYRGAVEDNYIKFAGFYWRIIRVNGDGSLRIIYDGTSSHTNGTNSTNRLVFTSLAYNIKYNDAKYVGYMYGPSGTGVSTSKEEAQTNIANSDIKMTLENWYKTNIVDKGYDGYVSDNMFCNDRTTPGKEATGWSSDTGLGYGTNATGHGATARFNAWNRTDVNEVQPKFRCENKNDAFTKEDTDKGNGKLEQKVGLITADEIVAAGSGDYGTANSNYYLYKGNWNWYWTFSPCGFNAGYAGVFRVDGTNNLDCNFVNDYGGIAPVISLSAEYVSTMSGNGTATDPFEVI